MINLYNSATDRFRSFLFKLVKVEQEEVRPLLWSFSWGQFFFKCIVAHPAVTCFIPTTTKRHHLQDNMDAGLGRQPDAAQRKKIETFLRP